MRRIACYLFPLLAVFAGITEAGDNSIFFPSHASFKSISNRKVKIMPLGNSITSAFDGQASYRYWLWKLLETNGYAHKCDFVGTMHGVDDFGGAVPANPDFDQDHEGHRGRPAHDILAYMNEYMQANVPDIVLWHIGSNEIFYGLDPLASRTAMQGIIDSLRSHNPDVIIISAIVIPSGMGTEAHRYLNELASWLYVNNDKPNSPFIIVDMHNGFDINMDLMADRVHLNEQGEQKMAARWYKALVPVLNSMIGKPCEISPPSGKYGSRQKFDFLVSLRFPAEVYYTAHELTIDGKPVRVLPIIGTRQDGGKTFKLGNASCQSFGGAGTHEVAVKFHLSGGFIVTDTARYIFETHTEP
jgi:hypothetical protein